MKLRRGRRKGRRRKRTTLHDELSPPHTHTLAYPLVDEGKIEEKDTFLHHINFDPTVLCLLFQAEQVAAEFICLGQVR